jgi:hypothetical protein
MTFARNKTLTALTQNESAFWTGIAETLSPGWRVRLGRAWAPGVDVGSHDLYIYAVDARTGCIWVAAMTSAEAYRLIETVTRRAPAKVAAHDCVAQAISDVASLPDRGESDEYEWLMLATTMALSTTESFRLARAGEDGACTHCLYVAYTANDGSFIGRPAVVKSKTSGALPPVMLINYLRKIVAMDTGPDTTEVARTIAASGGTSVAKEFK